MYILSEQLRSALTVLTMYGSLAVLAVQTSRTVVRKSFNSNNWKNN
jgi:hypothetical protein